MTKSISTQLMTWVMNLKLLFSSVRKVLNLLLDGPSIPSRKLRTSIFGASSTLRAIAGYRDRAAVI